MIKKLLQLSLGAFLTSAGISHLGSNRTEFLAQVPTWLPLNGDFVVVASGIVEITLGISLITTTFILTHCFLIPWTIENLNFIVNVFKQRKVSVYCLDLKMNLTTDVYGRPIADVLSYLNLMKLYNIEFKLGIED